MPTSSRSLIRAAAGTVAGAALLAATALPAGAQTPPPGVGATSGATTLLSVLVGEAAASPLALELVGETGGTTIDPADGVATAFERLVPITVSSSLVPALSALTTPAIESRSTGAEDSRSTEQINLGALADPLGVPGLLGGSINPVDLHSVVDAAGAVASASSALSELQALAGAFSLDSLGLDLAGRSGSDASIADRGLQLANLDLLGLQDLLAMVGVAIEDLPIDAALALVDGLGLPLPEGIASIGDLQTTIDGLQTDVDELTAIVSGLCTDDLPILGDLGLADCAAAQEALDTVNAALDAALDELQGLLGPVVDELAGASLLSLEGIDLHVLTDARRTVGESAATVTAAIGAVNVAGVELPGIDLLATVEQVEALADQVTSTLGSLLAGVDPSLADLVDVDLLDAASGVTEADGVVSAAAAVTGLRLTVTPPDICALVSGLGLEDTLGSVLAAAEPVAAPVGDLLADLGLAVPCLEGAVGQGLGQVLPDISALTAPLTVEALSVEQVSRHRVPAAPATPAAPASPADPTLPQTGGTATPLLFGLVAAGVLAGIAVRRTVRLAEVRANRD